MHSLASIGLGTFPFSNVFSKITEPDAERIIRAFIDMGGYYIDTAPIYGFGYVESLVGKILKGVSRSKYSITTKCGWVYDNSNNKKISGRYQDIISSCEKSLKFLGIDYIDYYISHTPDPETSYVETMDSLFWLQMKGKIKNIGVSNVTLDQLKQYNLKGGVSCIQNRFSLINRSIPSEFSLYCQSQNINLIPYQVIERGLLTDLAVNINIQEGDLRNKKTEFFPEKRLLIIQWVENHLRPISIDLGISTEMLAIWWTMNQPCVSFPIIGVTTTQQLIKNMTVPEIIDPVSILEQIDRSYYELKKSIYEQYSQSIFQFMGLVK